MNEASKIPIHKIRMNITGAEAILSACGDFHYGVENVTKEGIETALNETTAKYKGNIFRVYTGDLIENQLKSSVGHNYDSEIADPSIQKKDMIDTLIKTNKNLYGESIWRKLKVDNTKREHTDILSVAVEGNHEYRTRKVAAQWLTRDMCEASKTLYLGMNGIIELTIFNKKVKREKTYKIYVAHRPSRADATSPESILRAFKKKQSVLPGIDIFIFGHFHRKFLSANGYFDSNTNEFRKVLYVINPSPMFGAEYGEEAGYPPLEIGYSNDIFLPLDPFQSIWGIV